MEIIFSLLTMLMGLLGSLLFIRAYFWSIAVSARDPSLSFIWKLTGWLVDPVGVVIRPRGAWDWPSIASALIVAAVYTALTHVVTGYPVALEGMLIMPVALLFRWAIDTLSWILIIYCVMSFVPSLRFHPMSALLCTMVDPFLRPLRRFIPMVKGFDLSPLVLFLLLGVALRFITPFSQGYFAL